MTKKHSKRDQLLEAGLDAFFEAGFENTTIDAIVQRANCGKGTFYRYFANKDSLLEELETEFSDSLTGDLKRNCKDELPVKEYLFMGLKTFISIFKKHQRLGLIKFERENKLRHEDRVQSACKTLPNLYYMRGYIEQAIKDGKLRNISAELLIVTLLGAGHFLLFRDFKLGIPFNDQEIEEIVNMILKGALPQ